MRVQKLAEITETIQVAVVELKSVALPHEIAHLHELAADAADAETEEQLAQIRVAGREPPHVLPEPGAQQRRERLRPAAVESA